MAAAKHCWGWGWALRAKVGGAFPRMCGCHEECEEGGDVKDMRRLRRIWKTWGTLWIWGRGNCKYLDLEAMDTFRGGFRTFDFLLAASRSLAETPVGAVRECSCRYFSAYRFFFSVYVQVMQINEIDLKIWYAKNSYVIFLRFFFIINYYS